VRFLQRSANLFAQSHCRSDFLLGCHELTTNLEAGMTSESFIYDPAHWRTRADEARILAKELDDSESRDAMLRMAQDYERLAQWVEDRALRGRLPKN
jgi:hypothetical protein